MHIQNAAASLVDETPEAPGLYLTEDNGGECVELTLFKGGTIPAHAPKGGHLPP